MADILAALQRRSKSIILATTALVLLAVAAMQVIHLRVGRERALTTAAGRAGNTAAVLSEYIRGSFASVDTSLRQIAAQSPRLGGPAGPADVWTPVLQAAHAALTGSGSLSITDAGGTIRHSTLGRIVGESRRDSYVHQELSGNPRAGLVVDRPRLSLSEPIQYILPLGRPLRSDDGTFEGSVVATVLPEGYREFFRTVDVGARGIVWVFHPDRLVLFREPSDGAAMADPAGDHPLLGAAANGAKSGALSGPLEPGGRRYISAFHSVGAPPLVVGISLSESDVLADWRHQRQSSALAFGLLALTLGASVFATFRQMDARGRAEAELTALQREESEWLRRTNEQLGEALEREQQARQESEQASYMKDEFLMTVSHELRTPLNSIYGWVRMLGSDALPPEQRQRALEAVERNARAQARIIEDLLDVSSSITGQLRLDPHETDVAETVLSAVETSRPAIEAKGLLFDAVIEPDLPAILADPHRLQQVVWNLLSNAVKFTPAGGRVTVAVARTPAGIEISVSDSGVGIDPAFLPFVFDRFRQGDAGARRRFGGLGLGLAIVQLLVELHGGTATIESAGPDAGTTVRVTIPARAVRPANL